MFYWKSKTCWWPWNMLAMRLTNCFLVQKGLTKYKRVWKILRQLYVKETRLITNWKLDNLVNDLRSLFGIYWVWIGCYDIWNNCVEVYLSIIFTIASDNLRLFVFYFTGIKQHYKLGQHLIPKHLNTRWKQTHLFGYGGYAVRKFQSLYREKLWNEKRKAKK